MKHSRDDWSELSGVGDYSNGVGGSISFYTFFVYEIRFLSVRVRIANSHDAQFFADISSKPKSTPPNFSV